MSLVALGLALLAAVFHAAWNLVVKASHDQLVAAWTVVAGAAILSVPVLVFAGLPDSSVWDLILISTIVQVVYVLMLALASPPECPESERMENAESDRREQVSLDADHHSVGPPW